jgi:DNA-binding response OmpR family regulator
MRILLIEDSPRLQESVARGLRNSGYAIDVVGDGRQGLIYAQTTEYDVIVLDLMLPEVDGLTVLRELRDKNIQTHVLILTARDSVEDRVRGLHSGADDYLVKPFAFDELLARIAALARRQHAVKSPRAVIGDVEIDLAAKRVARAGGNNALGAAIDLTQREYALLEYLVCRRGKPVSRLELEEHIYDDRKRVMSNTVDSAVCTLRAKLQAAGCRPIIHTRRRLGYIVEDRTGRDDERAES